MTSFPERQVVQLGLVRAVEEHAPSLLTREQVAAATITSLDAGSDAEIVEKRTAYLYLCLPKSLRNLGHVALLPENLVGLCLGLAALAGIVSNYLGPSGAIHVAYNPLSLLLAWNMVMLGSLAVRKLRRRGAPREKRSFVSDLYLRWSALRVAWSAAPARAEDTARAASAFLSDYRALAGHIVAMRLEALLHIGSIGILGGALAGTYLRGLFSEYTAIWRSTFLTTPEAVTAFLNVFLGPASLLWNGRLLTSGDVLALLAPQGAPAAQWIHLLTIMLAIVVPVRVALALSSWRRAKAASHAIGLDLAEPYFSDLIREVREGVGTRLREGIATAFRLEAVKLSESVAVFVCEGFFDRSIAPALVGFRNRGGRIDELEREIREATQKFEPALLDYLASAQRELQRGVATQVRAVVGREVAPASEVVELSAPASLPIDVAITDALAAHLGDAAGATVTATVAVAAATLSGGLGKSLGLAVVTALLHTSGPIGLLLGGVAGIAVAGGAYVLGRDRITASIKRMRIPASLASFSLRDSRIAAARQETYSQIRLQIENELQPRIRDVTEAILAELPRNTAQTLAASSRAEPDSGSN